MQLKINLGISSFIYFISVLVISTTYIYTVNAYVVDKNNGVTISRRTDISLATTSALDISNDVEKRWLLTMGFAIYKVTNFSLSILGLVSSCKSFNHVVSGIECVWGCLTTFAAVSGRVHNVYGSYKEALSIAEGLKSAFSNGQTNVRREINGTVELDTIIEHANEYFRNVYQMNHTYHGYIFKNSTFNGHLVPESYDLWPVFQLTNPRGLTLDHTIYIDEDNNFVHRFGIPNSLDKRDSYNNEYFTAGAMDATACQNRDASEHTTKEDFDAIESIIKCAIPDPGSVSDIEYQLYDKSVGGTLSDGVISGVGPNGRNNIRDYTACPTGLTLSGCGSVNVDSKH